MKRKLLLITVFALMFICIFAFSISAKELDKYCDAKITFTDDTVVTAYFQIHSWNNRWVVNRENIYKTTNTDDGTYSWSDVKVLDFRDFNYTEKYPPVALQGINCNSLAKNVTTVYLPSTTTIILNTSFTGGWKSLDTVYIPKGVTEISYDAFNGCPVKNVIIEENSQIKSIGDNAFRGCDITSFDFANTALLETIGYCAFYTSDLSGKVVLPNSVTSIGDGAFRSTQIETLVLGDGPVCLGYNLVGNDGGTSKTNLKEVYISAKSTFNEKKLSEIWFSNGSTINFYVIGSNDEVSEFIPKLKNTGRVKFATEEEIQNGTAVSGYNAVIITGYNICDAFYDSKHTFSDTPDFVYENAITEFYQENACLNCNNKYKTGDTYAPVLKFSGYSIKNDGSAFCVGYSVNKDSYQVLTSKFGKTLNYGIVVSLATDDNDFLEIKDGEVSVKDGFNATKVAISNEYSSFELVLTGFTNESMDKALVMCAYSYDGTKITYLTNTENTVPKTVTYNQIAFS